MAACYPKDDGLEPTVSWSETRARPRKRSRGKQGILPRSESKTRHRARCWLPTSRSILRPHGCIVRCGRMKALPGYGDVLLMPNDHRERTVWVSKVEFFHGSWRIRVGGGSSHEASLAALSPNLPQVIPSPTPSGDGGSHPLQARRSLAVRECGRLNGLWAWILTAAPPREAVSGRRLASATARSSGAHQPRPPTVLGARQVP